jgi:UDP-N-acetylglucosamine:LPS N-acetylglucosamine transferase|tara:strand:+ start:2648 stop:2938 length:291 start_codon:yes stop_codon:yes gene_type:complete
VLIPSPNVAEDHQTKNALSLKESGCAEVLAECDLGWSKLSSYLDGQKGQDILAEMVSGLLRDPERLARMSAAAATSDTPHSATEIARDVAAAAAME